MPLADHNSFILYGGVSFEPMNGLVQLKLANQQTFDAQDKNLLCRWDLLKVDY